MSTTAPISGPSKPAEGTPESRTIVIFADGTGNAFTRQQTNVWRMYCALDKSSNPAQIARYMPGVGTQSNTLLRMFDAATGFGAPQNVRKLYRFLCWNWSPGDRIVLIGFSRGSFTVRTLAGLITRQGLMPRKRKGVQVSTEEMKRNTMGAWRAYRAATFTRKDGLGWTVVAMRGLRDRVVSGWRRFRGHDLHSVLEDEIRFTERGPVRRNDLPDPPVNTPPGPGVMVDFLGVFETVEAFGVPVEEIRTFLSRWVIPLTFSNNVCSASVREARHALAIDEERLSFRHMRFDATARSWQSVTERWFAGVHSDIGGGYPDDHASVEPLQWMAGASGLRFRAGALDALAGNAFPRAPIHDSRGGMAAFYRYEPRFVDRGQTADPSVADKIRDHADVYAPFAIRNGINVVGGAPIPSLASADMAGIGAEIRTRRLLNRLLILLPGVIGLALIWAWQSAGAALPLLALGVLAILAAVLFSRASGMADRLRDRAALAWAAQKLDGFIQAPEEKDPRMGDKPVERFFAAGLLLTLCAYLILGGIALITWVCPGWLHASAHCIVVAQAAPALTQGGTPATEIDARSPCQPLGITVEAGVRYRLSARTLTPFRDDTYPATLAGVSRQSWIMRTSAPFRRLEAPLLSAVVQIGRGGPMIPLADGTTTPEGDFTAEFTAPVSGPLLFFVNDVRWFPWVFYNNNHGTARVMVTRL